MLRELVLLRSAIGRRLDEEDTGSGSPGEPNQTRHWFHVGHSVDRHRLLDWLARVLKPDAKT